jgi:multicomponent Na+:H+ antiporter subunit E
MHYLRLTLFLAAFWLLLSGHYAALILSLGVLSILIVAWFVRRMDKVDGEFTPLRVGVGLLQYLGWLMWQVVLSNIALVRRIWDPALPIKPTWQRVDTKVSTPLEKALYANSITLTPGTLTTDVKEDHFMIHCLTPEGIDELKEGEMEDRIRRLGI